jgi:hypothetical protein
LSTSPGAMVLGLETANRTPSTVPPPARSVPDLDPAALDHGHTDHAHILSHAIATGTVSLHIHNNMRSQDGEVEGRPPYLHVGSVLISAHLVAS